VCSSVHHQKVWIIWFYLIMPYSSSVISWKSYFSSKKEIYDSNTVLDQESSFCFNSFHQFFWLDFQKPRYSFISMRSFRKRDPIIPSWYHSRWIMDQFWQTNHCDIVFKRWHESSPDTPEICQGSQPDISLCGWICSRNGK
jgi:hypothetical protein